MRQETRGLIRAAMRLDSPVIEECLTELVRRNGVVFTWEQVMVPALRAVGRRWELSEDRYVEVEHLLAWHVSGTLRAVAAPAAHAHRDSVPALLSCLPGEQHTLPMEALDAALSERGIPRRTLGGSVPADALLSAVRRIGPAAVVLWSQTHSTAHPRLARRVASTQWGVRGARRGPMVLLAGPGWGRADECADLVRSHDLRHALSIVEQLVLTSAVSTEARQATLAGTRSPTGDAHG
ncbi:B12-binding domain-containing protein [Actinacidiphila rubida]|nr:B12-binding domain-containing protein [Actinacidiphila rubida]